MDNINILYLEDDESDFVLITSILHSEIKNCTFTHVVNKKDFIKNIKNNKYHLILSDFAIPGFDGLEALDIKNAVAADIPFIFISGNIGEERAIDALTRGASDYVLKDRVSKLVPSVKRALDEFFNKVQRRAAEKTYKAELIKRNRKLRKLNEQIQRNVALLKIAGTVAKLGGWALDIPDLRLTWSDELSRLYDIPPGYTPSFEEALNFCVAQDRRKIHKAIYDSISTGRNFDETFRVITASGRTIWVRSIGETVTDNNNAVTRIQGALQDITDHVQLQSEQHKLSQAIEYSPVSVIITNQLGEVDYVNNKFISSLGYSLQEVKGSHVAFLRSGFHDDKFYFDIWQTAHSGRSWEGEILMKCKNGQLCWNHVYLSPLYDSEGSISGFVIVNEDITKTKKLIDELIAAKEAAERSNKLRDAFIANISHEIRTPLNGILGLTSIVDEIYRPLINPDDEELFAGIQHSGRRLYRTIDLIMNFSGAQTGNTVLQKQNIPISSIITNIIALFKPLINNVQLNFDDRTNKMTIFADEYTVTEAISNVIENAVKYTPRGQINVILDEIDDHVVLTVQDTGIGIKPENLESIFLPYMQEEMGYNRAYEGVGLGLSIVKEFLKLNNARISVQSQKNIGSIFTIIFENISAA